HTSISPNSNNIQEILRIPVHPLGYRGPRKRFPKMSKKQRKAVTQKNGAKAAGSKSPEGLQKSSMNALRHGCMAQTLVLTNESQEKFDQLTQDYIDRFKPADNVEMGLVNEMVAA